MNPSTNTQDEDAFMNNLLAGLDDTFFDAVPSPDPTPKKAQLVTVPPRSQATQTIDGVFDIAAKPLTPLEPKISQENLENLLEGASDWDWGDMNDDFLSPKKNKKDESKVPVGREKTLSEQPSMRCIVESSSASASCDSEKQLKVFTEGSRELRSVILKDDWKQMDIRRGDTLSIIGAFDEQKDHIPSITITAAHNLVIHHPDILLTATSISSAPQCSRRPLISQLLRSTSDVSPALVWGNALHEVVQKCLASRRWDEKYLDILIANAVRTNLNDLVRINVGVNEAKDEMRKRAAGLKSFFKRFVADHPKPDALLSNTREIRGTTSLLAITNLHDVEEDIWIPKLGLKGKIDAAVQATILERNAISQSQSSLVMPFEIKTGRTYAALEHRAQTMLYTLLVSERYGMDVTSGLLYYTQSDEVIRVPAGRNELRALLLARNEMAQYMMRRGKPRADGSNDWMVDEPFLPPTIDDSRVCGRCFVSDACMLYKKAYEPHIAPSSETSELLDMKTSHLSSKQLEFFRKWEQLISYEEKDMNKFRKELWTMGAREREQKGRCLGSMKIDPTYRAHASQAMGPLAKQMRIHQHTYRFVRLGPGANNLLNGHISIGDPVTLSVEPNLLALTRGFVLDLGPREIVIGVDRSLSHDYISLRLPTSLKSSNEPVSFRIDKDELMSGMGRIRDNVAQLFYVNGNSRLLQLVVDLKPPVFTSRNEPCIETLAKSSILNVNQLQAVEHALNAQDYALILGMPGTGKTTTIAEIIRVLVEKGKTVLLTSYTHSAVDTILLKLKDNASFDILRLGNLDKIHPDLHQFSLSPLSEATTVEQLEKQILYPPVVATTCLSIDHALFLRRKFDYCIVDEASQITLPTCVGPLRFAQKFLLVGDHFQLPPLVKSREARMGGLDVSLFRRLSDAHPLAVVDLAYQYRMNEDIMLLSNKLIYRDRLKCGSQAVAQRSLHIPFPSAAHTPHVPRNSQSKCWLQHLLDKSCKAIFVDTDQVPALESRIGDLVQNEVEAKLVQQVTDAFIKGGVSPEEIGIISLYRQQIKLISHLLKEHDKLEILTADRSQGKDKECIIVSLVRANEEKSIGDLLKDWRRINVAFTRARSKLIIFGSQKTLQSSPLLSEFFTLMDANGWIFSLPSEAHKLHLDIQSAPSKRGAKRPIDDNEKVTKENMSIARSSKKAKKTTLDSGLVRARPVLRDLLNGSI